MMNEKTLGYFRLLRPANIVTACADILAGFGIAAVPLLSMHPIAPALSMYRAPTFTLLVFLLLLLIATAGLYGGGVVLNDVCDATLDMVERPERPIPKGIISKRAALILACLMFLIGIMAASLVSLTSGVIAAIIVLLCVSYDAYTKPHLILGPINIALCRSLNVLLGISIIAGAISTYWQLMLISFVYIMGVSLISKEEVTIARKNIFYVALVLYTLAIIGVLLLAFDYQFDLIVAVAYLILFSIPAYTFLIKAIRQPEPKVVKKAVATGIICLIILDAAIASGYAGWWYGIIILVLVPISILLAKKFAVT